GKRLSIVKLVLADAADSLASVKIRYATTSLYAAGLAHKRVMDFEVILLLGITRFRAGSGLAITERRELQIPKSKNSVLKIIRKSVTINIKYEGFRVRLIANAAQ